MASGDFVAAVGWMSERKVSPHTGRDEEEDDPYVAQLGCRVEYEALEECLADHDRDWRRCQAAEPKGRGRGNLTNPTTRAVSAGRILKAAKAYPSVKREGIIAEIKSDFRANKSLTDEEAIASHVRAAVNSLEQLEQYAGMDRSSEEWQLYLRGGCP
eukprot:evm.model.scf_1526.4 EVM.evm.TU.scf_1526.4   scf_1526:28614-29378(+)